MRKMLKMLAVAFSVTIVSSVFVVGCGNDRSSTTGGTSGAGIASEKLTADEWATAFDYSAVASYSVKHIGEFTQKGSASTVNGSEKLEQVFKIDGNKQFASGTAVAVTAPSSQSSGQDKREWQGYVYTDGGKTYTVNYDYDAKAWQKEHNGNRAEGLDSSSLSARGWFGEYIDKYAEFAYDDAKRGYVKTETLAAQLPDGSTAAYQTTYSTLFKFKDKKLIYAENTEDDEKHTAYQQITVYDIGVTTLTIPSAVDVVTPVGELTVNHYEKVAGECGTSGNAGFLTILQNAESGDSYGDYSEHFYDKATKKFTLSTEAQSVEFAYNDGYGQWYRLDGNSLTIIIRRGYSPSLDGIPQQ